MFQSPTAVVNTDVSNSNEQLFILEPKWLNLLQRASQVNTDVSISSNQKKRITIYSI